MKKILLFILTIGLALATQAGAKSLYVSTTGNDSTSYAANDISHPWLTPAHAWITAQAGDTVYFRAGTYTISSTTSTYAQGYHGTSENPITFTVYPGESVTLDATVAGIDPVFYIEKNYNVVDGFTLRSVASFFNIAYDTNNVTGFTLKNCTAYMTVGGGDNSGVVKSYAGGNYITVQNNTIVGPGTGVNANNAGIWVTRTQHLTIKNNDISGFPAGINFKHSNTLADTGNEISYNYIHGNGWGFKSVPNYTTFRHNIFNNSTDIFLCDDGGIGDGGLGCQYNTFSHNTGLANMNCQEQGNGTCYHTTLTDNIFGSKNVYAQYNAETLYMTSDYNLYPTGNIVIANRTDYTLSAWASHNSSDAHSVSSAATFSGGATPSTIAGFALTAASAGYLAGSDGKNMGADVSLVGVNAGAAASPTFTGSLTGGSLR